MRDELCPATGDIAPALPRSLAAHRRDHFDRVGTRAQSGKDGAVRDQRVTRRAEDGVQFRHAHLHRDCVVGLVKLSGIGVPDNRINEFAIVGPRRDPVGKGLPSIHVGIGLDEKLIGVIGRAKRISAGGTQNIMRRVRREAHLPGGLPRDEAQVRDAHRGGDGKIWPAPGSLVARRQNIGGVRGVNPRDAAFLQILAVIGDLLAIQTGNPRRHHFIRTHGRRAGWNDQRGSLHLRWQIAAVNAGPAELARHIGVPIVIVVIVGVGNHGRALRIERDLEVIDQVSVVRAGQAAFGNIGGMDDVLRLGYLDFAERRIG